MSNNDFVYFIQRGDENGPIKIGYSCNPAARLVNLQGGHFERLHLIGLTAGSRHAESRIHDQLREWSLGREWYSPSPEVFAFIEESIPHIAGALDAVLEAKELIHNAVRWLRAAQHEEARDALAAARDRLDEALDSLPEREEVA